MREALREWLIGKEPTLFVTFNYGYSAKVLNGETKLRAWCKRIERRALGRNWSKFSAAERLVAIGFWERTGRFENTHCHSIIVCPPTIAQVISNEGKDIWLDLVPRGQLHVEVPRSARRVANYITKGLPKFSGDGFDRTFIY